MNWIEKTPAGRLGFSNYRVLAKFCERHGIEVPTRPRRNWTGGVIYDERDWARLEKEQGERIRALRVKEQEGYVAVADIARLFGITRARAVLIVGRRFTILKVGRSYVVAREGARDVINYVRGELERAYVRRRTKRFPKAVRDG